MQKAASVLPYYVPPTFTSPKRSSKLENSHRSHITEDANESQPLDELSPSTVDNVKVHIFKIEDEIEEAKTTLLHTKREKSSLGVEVGYAKTVIDKKIKSIEDDIMVGINARFKELKLAIKYQQQDSQHFERQMNMMSKEDVQTQEILELCKEKLDQLEVSIGDYKKK